MTQPSDEAMNLAGRIRNRTSGLQGDWFYFNQREAARDIDALTEQRVAATVERIRQKTPDRARILVNAIIAEAADRPAPEGAAPTEICDDENGRRDAEELCTRPEPPCSTNSPPGQGDSSTKTADADLAELRKVFYNRLAVDLAASVFGPAPGRHQPVSGEKLWLWKNGDHYLAFAHEYPTYGGGDPMVLGEPFGYAILVPSEPRRTAVTGSPGSASYTDAVQDFSTRLSAQQEPLGDEFTKVLHKMPYTESSPTQMVAAPGPTAAGDVGQPHWTCFHCRETFNDPEGARLHFGDSCMSDSACQINIKQVREMERLHERHLAEDSDTDRAMYRMRAEHTVALRQEEEKGYALGLKDGREELLAQIRKPTFNPSFIVEMAKGGYSSIHILRALADKLLVAHSAATKPPDPAEKEGSDV